MSSIFSTIKANVSEDLFEGGPKPIQRLRLFFAAFGTKFKKRR